MICREAIGHEQKNHIPRFGHRAALAQLPYQSPADGTFVQRMQASSHVVWWLLTCQTTLELRT